MEKNPKSYMIKEIKEALKISDLGEFVNNLPKKLHDKSEKEALVYQEVKYKE